MVLPFAFMPSMGLWSVLLSSVAGYQLLGLEDIGVEIESPFGFDYNDLPVDSLQSQIFNNLITCLSKINEERVRPRPSTLFEAS
jgi:putative membrane protein